MKHKLTVILCSIREGRRGQLVADWFLPIVRSDTRFEVTIADLADFDMPLKMEFKEPSEYKDKKYPTPVVQRWSDIIDNSEAYIFITPEYNHAMPASLKNAIDQIYWEWLDKPIGFVGYGSHGAPDAINSLKHTVRTLKWHQVEPHVGIMKVKYSFDEAGHLIDSEEYEKTARQMLDSLANVLDNRTK